MNSPILSATADSFGVDVRTEDARLFASYGHRDLDLLIPHRLALPVATERNGHALLSMSRGKPAAAAGVPFAGEELSLCDAGLRRKVKRATARKLRHRAAAEIRDALLS